MTNKEFQKLLNRDLHCVHCGTTDETLVVNHRANRGMGGSHKRHRPSNWVVMCSWFNGMIESSAEAAKIAKSCGWKLESWEDAKSVPIWDNHEWYLLDDEFNRVHLPNFDHID